MKLDIRSSFISKRTCSIFRGLKTTNPHQTLNTKAYVPIFLQYKIYTLIHFRITRKNISRNAYGCFKHHLKAIKGFNYETLCIVWDGARHQKHEKQKNKIIKGDSHKTAAENCLQHKKEHKNIRQRLWTPAKQIHL